MKTALTEHTLRNLAAHVAGQDHAMAGSSAAITGALGSSLGEACVRISALYLEDAREKADTVPVAERLAAIREQLLGLADEDSAVIAAYAAERDAGEEPRGQDRLCSLPVEMGNFAAEAGDALQDFRPFVRHVQDDLEIAIALLASATRAASMVLDSNLRIWPEAELVTKYEPALAELRKRLEGLHPAERFR
jgi:formiminotetrahydrofolate cyclodeaminase